jgi:serine protease Do
LGRAALLRCLLAWAFAAPVLADLPETLERIKPSIVGVGTFAPLRQPRSVFLGTGWVIGDGKHAITNHHVVDRRLDQKKQEVHAIFVRREDGQPRAYQAKVLACDKAHDLCLLRFQGIQLKPLRLGHASEVKEGREYAMTGFPIGMVLGLHPVTSKGIVSSITPIAIPALSERQLTPQVLGHLGTPFKVFQLDALAYPGNSGSPLYDVDSGKVVGVVNSVFVKESKESVLSTPSAIAYAIPVTHVYDLLLKAKLDP